MWVLLLSIAYAAGGGQTLNIDFATKEMCVQAAQSFAQSGAGQVRWVCAPRLKGGDAGDKPISGK